MLKTFKIGGVHPPENKLSAAGKIQVLPIPEKVIIPLHGKNYTTIIQSYVIRACPLFLPDGKSEPPRIYRKWIVEVDGEWLTTQETRERLGIDRHEIYKLIERGKLNARQVDQMS